MKQPFLWPDERQEFRAFAARTLERLLATANDIQTGKQLSVTRFKAVAMLFTSRHYPEFVVSILKRVKAEFERDRFSPLVSLAEKSRLFDLALVEAERMELFSDYNEWDRFCRNQPPLLLELENLQPEEKRIWVHASRRKATDRDLLLAEYALFDRCSFDNPGYRMLKLFLTTYEGYRYYLRPDADERAMWLASFWIRALFGMTIDEFKAWFDENAGQLKRGGSDLVSHSQVSKTKSQLKKGNSVFKAIPPKSKDNHRTSFIHNSSSPLQTPPGIKEEIDKAFTEVRDGERRWWLLKARNSAEIAFIAAAPGEFWTWLGKVKWCSHLHIDLDGESRASMPQYHCLYCGAVLICRCSTTSGSIDQIPSSCRPRRWEKEIPFAPFSDVFIRTRLCPHCRMELALRQTGRGCALVDVLKAIRLGDVYLTLKMLLHLWFEERTALKKHKQKIKTAFKDGAMEWAVHEYGLFCEGGYAGFEGGLAREAGFARWLYDVIKPGAPDDLLAGGNVITNIVGMAHTLGTVPLDLHAFFHKEQITLTREPGNVHDPDAVAVIHPRLGRMGYIKRSLTAWLAPIIDRGTEIETRIFGRHYQPEEPDGTVFLTLKAVASGGGTAAIDRESLDESRTSPHSCHDFTQDELSRTVRNLDKAHYHIRLARELIGSRKHEKDIIINRIRAAFNRVREAWLFKFAITPGALDDKDTLMSTFWQIAPAPHLKKSCLLDQRLRFLYYGHPFLPLLYEGGKAPPEAWETETLACLGDIEQLIGHIEKGTPLTPFRWETDEIYRPGQWVWELNDLSSFETRYRVILKKILAVQEGKIIISNPDTRTIDEFHDGTLMVKPSLLPDDDMTTPFERRRSWFDIHPEYRQIPLVVMSYRNYGSSLYFTCPCCGYPTMTSHPEYNPVYSDDPYDDGFSEEDDDDDTDEKTDETDKDRELRNDDVDDVGGTPPPDKYSEYYEICPLCDWAETGGERSSKKSGHRNGGYDIDTARKNFEAHRCIYRPEDKEYFEYQTDEESLLLKNRLCAAFDAMIGATSQGRIYVRWCEAVALRKQLIEHSQFRQSQCDPEAFKTRYTAYGRVIGRDFENKWKFAIWPGRPGQWGYDIIDGRSMLVWIGRYAAGYVGKIRSGRGKIRDVTLPCFAPPYEDKPDDDVWRPFYFRRTWFEVHQENYRGHYCCPCCGYPTISSRNNYVMCDLCSWEDDGQDDDAAQEVWGGPNGDYSLREARDNFEKHLTMFRSSEPGTSERINCDLQIQDTKLKLTASYDCLIIEREENQIDSVWREIDANTNALSCLRALIIQGREGL